MDAANTSMDSAFLNIFLNICTHPKVKASLPHTHNNICIAVIRNINNVFLCICHKNTIDCLWSELCFSHHHSKKGLRVKITVNNPDVQRIQPIIIYCAAWGHSSSTQQLQSWRRKQTQSAERRMIMQSNTVEGKTSGLVVFILHLRPLLSAYFAALIRHLKPWT